MALGFTDQGFRAIAKELLEIPTRLSVLTNQKNTIDAQKTEAENLDTGVNKVFFDLFKNNVDQYQNELAACNGTTHTEYLEQELIDAANNLDGNKHFPVNPGVEVWTSFTPKVIDANLGDPEGTASNYELLQIDEVSAFIGLLRDGFSDGAVTDTLFNAQSGTTADVTTGGFSIGQKVLIDNGPECMYAEITNVTINPNGSCAGETPPGSGIDQTTCITNGGVWTPFAPGTYAVETLELNILASSGGSLPAGSQIRNFHSGFDNDEREGTSPASEPDVLTCIESFLEYEITTWKGFLETQKTALEANGASGVEESQNQSAFLNVDTSLALINNFETAPATGAGVGKYGDNVLNPLVTNISTRQTEIPARATEIGTSLGSISQNPDGTFSGSGQYYELFRWIDIRINKSGSSLRQTESLALVSNAVDQRLGKEQTKKSAYDDTVIIRKFDLDSDGTAFVTLSDISDLSISDSVKVVEQTTLPIITATIVNINGNIVELDTSLSGYTTANNSVLLKEL